MQTPFTALGKSLPNAATLPTLWRWRTYHNLLHPSLWPNALERLLRDLFTELGANTLAAMRRDPHDAITKCIGICSRSTFAACLSAALVGHIQFGLRQDEKNNDSRPSSHESLLHCRGPNISSICCKSNTLSHSTVLSWYINHDDPKIRAEAEIAISYLRHKPWETFHRAKR